MSGITDLVKEALGTDSLTHIGGASGCVNTGVAYRTREGQEVFVKINNKKDALRMFKGEEASLNAIADTNTIICPRPIKVLEKVPGGGCALIMDYLDMKGRGSDEELGKALAKLHFHNIKLIEAGDEKAVTRYGFHLPTCCGYLPQKNDWRDDWVEFFCEKIDHQLSMLKPQDATANKLWSELRPKVGELFEGVQVKPSLLHGDLWSGNAGCTADGPVVFDASSFYGHHEYDLGIAAMFGSYSTGSSFAKAYHSVIPKAPGFDKRNQLYQLFHHLNHWTHFGTGYRGGSISIMERLLRTS